MQKLELTWVGKNDPREHVEPRILLENEEFSYGEPEECVLPNGKNWHGNMIIHGDNLLALKALEQHYSGCVKCIYIDPPYNTGKAFENYDDMLEHSIWLDLMRQRLVILHNLLSDDGFICCHIDDSEGHYLKVLMDEVFNRNNYLTTFYIRVRYADKTLKQDMDYHKEIEYVHIYRKTPKAKPNKNVMPYDFGAFEYYFEEGTPIKTIELGGKRVDVFEKGQWKVVKREGTEDGRKEIWASGTILDGNSSGRFFRDYLTGRYEEDGYGVLYKVYNIGDDKFDYRYFTGPNKVGATKGKYYQGVPTDKLDLSKKNVSYSPINNFYDLAASFGNCRGEGGVEFRGGKKPEALLNIILKHFSNAEDIVLDSFLGSGSTCAVAHKMNRKYIGVEMGEQAYTHCYKRLSSIIDGNDKTGITDDVDWQNGGGFKFYELAPSLLQKDIHGQMVINKEYNANMLAAAMAKHEGFNYSPSADYYWKQGMSSEDDFIYTTTQFITKQSLERIHDEMGDRESLLICCTAFQEECLGAYPNISIKKIPKMLLGRCQFDKDDYKLNIITLPDDEEEISDTKE